MNFRDLLNPAKRFNKIRDIGYLAVLQITNQIIPIIVIPLITQNIGIENYGKIAVCLAIIYGEKVLIDFGFDLFGVAWIGKYGNLKHKLNSFVINTIFLKLLIWMAFVVIAFTLCLFPFFKNEFFYLIFIGQGWLFGEIFFLKFFYQSTNRIGMITVFSVLSKFIMFLILITLFTFSDSIYVYFISLGVGSILSGSIAMFYLYRKKIIEPQHPKKRFILYLFSKNSGLLIGKTITYGYAHSITFVVQFILGYRYSGYLVICQKLVGGASSLILPVVEVIFPYISEKYNELSKKSFFELFAKNLQIVFALSIAPILVIILFSKPILEIFIPEYFPTEIILLLKILSLTIISSQIGTLFTQLMTITGRIRFYLANVVLTLTSTLLSTVILGLKFGIIGIGLGIIIGQVIHISLYILKMNKSK